MMVILCKQYMSYFYMHILHIPNIFLRKYDSQKYLQNLWEIFFLFVVTWKQIEKH